MKLNQQNTNKGYPEGKERNGSVADNDYRYFLQNNHRESYLRAIQDLQFLTETDEYIVH